jgi:single-strand DNA-binding protein
MINKVTLIGNLGKDPEVKHLESGASVARFSVATNENYRDKEGNWQTRTEWHVVVVWRALAERAERDLKKGSLVYVEGKLRTRNYQDSNGVERSITEVEGQLLRPLDRKDRNDDSFPSTNDEPMRYNSSEESKKPINASSSSSVENTSQSQNSSKFEEMPEDDLPF